MYDLQGLNIKLEFIKRSINTGKKVDERSVEMIGEHM